MANDQKVKDLMIPLEDYPHIPYWFTLRQAMAIVREAAIKFEGAFEPRAVLVFDEKYQLMGILTLRDMIKGLEPKFLQETSLVKMDPNLTVLMGDLSGPQYESRVPAAGERGHEPHSGHRGRQRPRRQGPLPDDQGKRRPHAGDAGWQGGRDDPLKRPVQ